MLVTDVRMYGRTHEQARIHKLPFRGSKNKQAKSQNLSPPNRLGGETSVFTLLMTINKANMKKTLTKMTWNFQKPNITFDRKSKMHSCDIEY